MAIDGMILVINSGSSSVKFGLFDGGLSEPKRVWEGAAQMGALSGLFPQGLHRSPL